MRFGFLVAVVLGLSACAPSENTTVGSFDPNMVSITCSGECTDAAGALIFSKGVPDGVKLARCTATLYKNNSQIITNAHCDDGITGYDAAYFILPRAGGRPLVSRVSAQIYDHRGKISGLERDLAIYQLETPVDAKPKKIAREIPSKMTRLTAYVVNQTRWDTDYTSLRLDKEVCSVMPKMPLFGGGAEDMTLGLGLFDCGVIPGNSGSALYASGDPDHIQGLMNTRWQWQADGSGDKLDQVVERLKKLFMGFLPSFMDSPYGMAERLHCVDVPGEESPRQYCHRLDMDQDSGELMRQAVQAHIEELLRAENSNDQVEWTVDAYVGSFGSSWAPRTPREYGVVLFTRPLCAKAVPASLENLNLKRVDLLVGLSDKGGGQTKILKQMNSRELEMFGANPRMDAFGARVFRAVEVVRAEFEASTHLKPPSTLPTCDESSLSASRIQTFERLKILRLSEDELLENAF